MRQIPIDGFEHYNINELGVVVNTKTGKVLKPDLNNCGYHRVTLMSDGQKKRIFVHRLVAMAYLEKIDGFDVVNHKDGNKLNNHYLNLEWTSTYLNTIHAFENGLRKGPNGLDKNVVKQIRHAMAWGMKPREIMDKYNIPKHRFDDIKRYYKYF